MIIYRPQRGTVEEAMKEAMEFEDEIEMLTWIVESANADFPGIFNVSDIVINGETNVDKNTGWEDARFVCVRRNFDKTYDVPQIIGMCATDYLSLDEYKKLNNGFSNTN